MSYSGRSPRMGERRRHGYSDGAHRVLDDLSMTVNAGEVYGLLGLNGAGKSTLMNAIMGLVPYSGHVQYRGESWRIEHLDEIGALINGPAFYPHLSAEANLLVHARLTGTAPARIGEVLEMVDLHAGNKNAGSFSTGMKMRLGIAMALLTDPALLMLDEPMNGLDPKGIHGIRVLLRELAARGCGVIVSSHQLSEVEHVADRIGVLTGSRIVFEGPLNQFAGPGESLEQAFFRTVGE